MENVGGVSQWYEIREKCETASVGSSRDMSNRWPGRSSSARSGFRYNSLSPYKVPRDGGERGMAFQRIANASSRFRNRGHFVNLHSLCSEHFSECRRGTTS